MTSSGKVDFHTGCDYVGGNRFVSLLTGKVHS